MGGHDTTGLRRAVQERLGRKPPARRVCAGQGHLPPCLTMPANDLSPSVKLVCAHSSKNVSNWASVPFFAAFSLHFFCFNCWSVRPRRPFARRQNEAGEPVDVEFDWMQLMSATTFDTSFDRFPAVSPL